MKERSNCSTLVSFESKNLSATFDTHVKQLMHFYFSQSRCLHCPYVTHLNQKHIYT